MDQRHNLLGRRNERRKQLEADEDLAKTTTDDDGVSQRLAAIRVRQEEGEVLAPNLSAFTEDEDEERPPANDSELPAGTFMASLRRAGIFAICFVVIVAAGTVLIVMTQAAILVREVGSWVPPARYAGYLAIVALILAVLVAAAQLVLLLVKLRKSPGFSLGALTEIRRRREVRMRFRQSEKYAVERLREYLESYPDDEPQLQLLRRAGFDSNGTSPAEIIKRRDELVAYNDGVSKNWLKRAKSQFFAPLDEAADAIIGTYARRLGVATAISPRSTVDSLIVIAGLYRLVVDLCRLYGVRPGLLETLYVLGQVVVVGAASAAADKVGDESAGTVEESISEQLEGALNGIGVSVAAQLGTRAAEGAVNWFFVVRVGRRLKRYLQPLGD